MIEDRIYYFDSNGNFIPANIKRLVDKIKYQGKIMNRKFILYKLFQPTPTKNSECGVYVIYFMIQMLLYNNWNKFKHGKITDDEVFKYRNKYFNDV